MCDNVAKQQTPRETAGRNAMEANGAGKFRYRHPDVWRNTHAVGQRPTMDRNTRQAVRRIEYCQGKRIIGAHRTAEEDKTVCPYIKVIRKGEIPNLAKKCSSLTLVRVRPNRSRTCAMTSPTDASNRTSGITSPTHGRCARMSVRRDVPDTTRQK